MTDKHTPGPWTVTDAIWDSGGDVAYILTGVKEACAADAHLIAAAPELLEALRTLVRMNNDAGPFGGEIYRDRVERAWDAARAAIAKATGGGND
jgi:hypothetical protein